MPKHKQGKVWYYIIVQRELLEKTCLCKPLYDCKNIWRKNKQFVKNLMKKNLKKIDLM
jgi:hypothetical protein